MNNTHQKNITWTCDEGVNINTIHPQRSCKCMWSLGEMFFSLPVIPQNVPGQYFLLCPLMILCVDTNYKNLFTKTINNV